MGFLSTMSGQAPTAPRPTRIPSLSSLAVAFGYNPEAASAAAQQLAAPRPTRTITVELRQQLHLTGLAHLCSVLPLICVHSLPELRQLDMFEILCRLSRACTNARHNASLLPNNKGWPWQQNNGCQTTTAGSWQQAAELHKRACVDVDDALIRKLRSLGVKLNAGARAARHTIYRLTFQSSEKLTPHMRDDYLVDMAIDFEQKSRERSRQRRKSNVPNLGPPGTRMHAFETSPCYETPGTLWRVVLNAPRGPRTKDIIVPDGHVQGAKLAVQLPVRSRRSRRSRHKASAPKP